MTAPRRKGRIRMSSCSVCNQPRAEGLVYCEYHQRAYENLEEAYKVWRRALGVGWGEFLEKVVKQRGTGAWARDVAEDILEGAH